MIPAFAIGRVEEILYWLKRLEEAQRDPGRAGVPRQSRWRSRRSATTAGAWPSSTTTCGRAGKPLASFATRRFQTVSSAQQSAELVGLANAGRHHLGERHGDRRPRAAPPRSACCRTRGTRCSSSATRRPGTRGRSLVDGAREVKIHGQFVPVSARVERIDSMSAHADCAEILRWLRGSRAPPAMTYIVHGEPPAMQALQAAIARELGPDWKTHAPEYLEAVEM